MSIKEGRGKGRHISSTPVGVAKSEEASFEGGQREVLPAPLLHSGRKKKDSLTKERTRRFSILAVCRGRGADDQHRKEEGRGGGEDPLSRKRSVAPFARRRGGGGGGGGICALSKRGTKFL